jgi:cytochrome P450 family 135
VNRPHFIISTGRCGSTLLSSILRSHPEILSISELFTPLHPSAFPPGQLSGQRFWELLSSPREDASLLLKHGLEPPEFLYPLDGSKRFTRATGVPPICVTALPFLSEDPDRMFESLERFVLGLPPLDVGSLYQRLFDWLAESNGKRMWVERSGSSAMYVGDLIANFPGARFVHLTRDGRACAMSMSRHPVFRMRFAAGMLESALGYDPYQEPRRSPDAALPAHLEPLMPDSFDPEVLRSLPIPVDRFGRQWSAMIVGAERRLDAVPSADVLRVSYERLLADPEPEIARLLGFLGAEDPGGGWLQRAASLLQDRQSPWTELPASERDALERACKPGMQRLQARESGAALRRASPGGRGRAIASRVRRMPGRPGWLAGRRGRRRAAGLPPGPSSPFSEQVAAWRADPEGFLRSCHDRYGDWFSIYLASYRSPPAPFVVFSDPQAVKALFVGGAALSGAAEVHRNVQMVIGSGSTIMLDGDAHLQRRRIVLPPFHGDHLAQYEHVMGEIAEREVGSWTPGESVQLAARLSAVSLEVILRVVFGVQDPARLATMREVVPQLSRPRIALSDAWQDRGRFAQEAEFRTAGATLAALLDSELAERRAARGVSGGADVLSLLMRAGTETGEQLSDEQIQAELRGLIGGGYETTSAALAWTFEFLMHHPAAMARAREDAGTGDGRYLDAVVKEALRLHPPVPVVTRLLRRRWRYGELDLAPGTGLAPCIYLAHRNPELYPRPDEFRPERFMDGAPETYAWLAFGGGVRRCIGASFAQLEMRIVLRTVLKRFVLEPASTELQRAACWRGLVLAPPGGTHAVVTTPQSGTVRSTVGGLA